MSVEIKNRRENIVITKIPPKILDQLTIEAELKTDGFVTTSDFPSTSVAGVIKLNPNRAVSHANGALQAIVIPLENYEALNNAAFISKGTLENVIFSSVKAKIQADMGALYENAELGDTWTVVIRKTADGLAFDYAPTE